MSFKLSQRGALFLGNTKEEAVEVNESLSDAYTKRSRLVHGSDTSVKKTTVINLHKLIARSILEFLRLHSSGWDHEDVISDLDERAITPQNDRDDE